MATNVERFLMMLVCALALGSVACGARAAAAAPPAAHAGAGHLTVATKVAAEDAAQVTAAGAEGKNERVGEAGASVNTSTNAEAVATDFAQTAEYAALDAPARAARKGARTTNVETANANANANANAANVANVLSAGIDGTSESPAARKASPSKTRGAPAKKKKRH